MSRDFQKELEAFGRVWQRVTAEKPRLPENLRLMPGRDKKDKSKKRHQS